VRRLFCFVQVNVIVLMFYYGIGFEVNMIPFLLEIIIALIVLMPIVGLTIISSILRARGDYECIKCKSFFKMKWYQLWGARTRAGLQFDCPSCGKCLFFRTGCF